MLEKLNSCLGELARPRADPQGGAAVHFLRLAGETNREMFACTPGNNVKWIYSLISH